MIPVVNECIKKGIKVSTLLPKESKDWNRISELDSSVTKYEIDYILQKKYQKSSLSKKIFFLVKIIKFGFMSKSISDLAIWSTFIFSSYRLLVDLMPMYSGDFFDYKEFLGKITPKIILFSRLSSTNETTVLNASKETNIIPIMLPHSYLSPGVEKFFFAGHLKFDSIFSIGKNFLNNFKSNPFVNKSCNIYDVGSVELEQLFFHKKNEKYSDKIKSSIES